MIFKGRDNLSRLVIFLHFSCVKEGTLQGSPLLPLSEGHDFVRYADDFIVRVRTELAAEQVMNNLAGFIEN